MEQGPSPVFPDQPDLLPGSPAHAGFPPGPTPWPHLLPYPAGAAGPGLALASLPVPSASWNVCLKGHDQDQKRCDQKGTVLDKGHGGRAAATRHCWAEGAHAPCVPGHPSSQLSPSFCLFFPRFVCVWPCPLLSWALLKAPSRVTGTSRRMQLWSLEGAPRGQEGMTPGSAAPRTHICKDTQTSWAPLRLAA